MQLIALLGAGQILGAYFALQMGLLKKEDLGFNLANLVGSIFLFVVAVHDVRWGFIVLEAAWSLVSLYAMCRHKGSHEQDRPEGRPGA